MSNRSSRPSAWRLARPVVVSAFAIAAVLAVSRVSRADGKLRLAIVEFTNGSSEPQYDSLGKGLQSMVTTDLAQASGLTIVERERLRDLQAELKLGKSGMVDPATAAKLGKLAGASHLVAGSFVVIGDKMRLDARVFTVGDGKIILAEKIEGDRDAFFELEKTLVKKVIDTVGVKLQPKERGAIAKVHTTDFDAFREFSSGVKLFDEKKYSEALDALRAAQNRDQDFKLATVTLAEYQGIISRLQARADELDTTQDQLQRLEQQKDVAGETEALKALHAIADRKGGNPVDRLAALYLLAIAYGNLSTEASDLYRLQTVSDRFALQRVADTLVQSYWVEASQGFPRFLPVVRAVGWPTPKTAQEVAAAMAAARADIEGGESIRRTGCADSNARESKFLCNLDWLGMRDDPVRQFHLRLHLDGRQTAELHQRLYDFAVKLNAPTEWRRGHLDALADEYRDLGDHGRSTAIYTQLAGLLTQADAVRGVTEKIAENRAIAELFGRSPRKELLRELRANLKTNRHSYFGRDKTIDLDTLKGYDSDPKSLARELAHSRMFPTSDRLNSNGEDSYLLIGEHPVWPIQTPWYALGSGPRPDPRRASAIRYSPRGGDVTDFDTLLVVDGLQRATARVAFDASFAVPSDFWGFAEDSAYKPDAKGRRPEVGFVFGMRNVDADLGTDPKTRKDAIVRPRRALVVRITETAVRLEELVGQGQGKDGLGAAAKEGMKLSHRELGAQAADLRSVKLLKLAFEVTADKVIATVNGKAYSFAVPKDHQGFYGVWFGGNGFAEVRGVTVNGK